MMPTLFEIFVTATGTCALLVAYAAVVVAMPDNPQAHAAAIWGLLAGGAIVAAVTVAALTWPAE